jgi:6-phosphogluconate dehydrogenase
MKDIGFIGLGRMGMNMVLNLLDKKYKPVVYNRSPEAIKKAARKGAQASYSIKEMIGKLPKRKIVWVMIKSGKPVDDTIKEMLKYMKAGDIIIDGGNSFFKDSIRRYDMLRKKGIGFIDCGVSGGISGARNGACMMIGGNKKDFKKTENYFKHMSVKNGYAYMGSSGAGHFVKMVHNGIEYGMMGALNEGFEAIKKHKKMFGTDLKEVAKVYDNGSIIEGSLTSWLYQAFQKTNYLDKIECDVPNGETEDEMKELEKLSKMDVLRAARLMRVESREKGLCGRYIAAMRNQFGGHAVKNKKEKKK